MMLILILRPSQQLVWKLHRQILALMDVSATTQTNNGTYTADAWSFVGNNNYNPANGTLDNTIEKATLTVTADPASKNCGEFKIGHFYSKLLPTPYPVTLNQ